MEQEQTRADRKAVDGRLTSSGRATAVAERFVVLLHQLPPEHSRPTHWDLMLEHDGQLRTWELPCLPGRPGPLVANQAISARRLPDHRLNYLQYEGPVSGDRGHVRRWDRGTLTWIRNRHDQLIVRLVGHRADGHLWLTNEGEDDRWTAVWNADARRGEHTNKGRLPEDEPPTHPRCSGSGKKDI